MNDLDDSANTDRCTLYEDSANEMNALGRQNIRPQQTLER